MAVFKCKMCDGNLNVEEGQTICRCPYCDTQQTVPSDSSENKVNLFNRANKLRIGCDFDKAANIYEGIVAEYPQEAEAYWGLCLCKFGIEYVDDPMTDKKIPTCHRTDYESIFDDENFDKAREYADNDALMIYQAEAKEIDRLQKEILDIAKTEEPFDVFICYKETAEDGQRTIDSVRAQEIYEALTAKEYKVFFSRITLEDKLGQDYEPYIFSALNSAKVMLVIGTKPEYFNAVWVKNEWGRFAALMRLDKSKTLIPCYCDMNPYEMPKEFRNLQGQDMSKVGFLQDLVRGVGKIIPKSGEAQKTVIANGLPAQSNEALLERAFMFLSNNDWESANIMCERVLDMDARCGRAYLGKLLAEYSCRSPEELRNLSIDITESLNYKNALQWGEDIEEYGTKTMYNTAVRLMTEKESYDTLTEAESYLEFVDPFEDSSAKLQECREIIERADKVTDNLRGVYRSYDENCEGPKADALKDVVAEKSDIKNKYPQFIGKGEIDDPWGPAPVNVWFIPLGLGLLAACFITLLFSAQLHADTVSETLNWIYFGIFTATALAAFIGNGVIHGLNNWGYVVITIIANIGYNVLGFWVLENHLQKAAPIFGVFGFLFVGVAVLLSVIYFKKRAAVHGYRRHMEKLDQLIKNMKERCQNALSEELFRGSEFSADFLNELLKKAGDTYRRSRVTVAGGGESDAAVSDEPAENNPAVDNI